MNTYNRFRLWRIDAAREKIETSLKKLVDPRLTHIQLRVVSTNRVMTARNKRDAAEAMMDPLVELRARCRRHANSLFTPMGGEMFYRYQQSMIDER
jgi:hypothetical protein